ncbi:MAG: 2-oxoacid:acceptor oxidoreductase family protein, partial [Candidatus Micrarchaeaceae archaeon]
MRLGWLIGGSQGLGVDTAANIFGNAVARAGYFIYGSREYYSNIKGRHSYFNVCISDKQQNSIDSKVDILASFDAETIFQHFYEVKKIMIYGKSFANTKIDAIKSMEPEIAEVATDYLSSYSYDVKGVLEYEKEHGVACIELDYDSIMLSIMNKLNMPPAVAERARNMIAVGASFSVLGLDKKFLFDSLGFFFKNKQFYDLNSLAVEAGYASSS